MDITLAKEWVPAFAVALLLAGGAGYSQLASQSPADGVTGSSDDMTWENTVTVQKNGETVARFHNTLTNQGKNWIRSQIADIETDAGTDQLSADTANATFISLGNGSTVQTDDLVLDKEISNDGGLDRKEGTTTTFGDGEFQVQNQFTASTDIGVVNTTGLNWEGTEQGNTLISGGTFAAEANILNGDQLTVTHNITIS